MSGVGSYGADDGSRRRLPSWMAGTSVHKSDDSVVDGDSKFVPNGKESSKFGVKSDKTTTRRRKSTQHPPPQQEDEEINNSVPQKKRKTVQERRQPKKKTKKKLKEILRSDDEIEVEDDDDNGEEQFTLTVEDLLSIAKEFVQADKEIGEVPSSNRDLDLGKRLAPSYLESGGGIQNLEPGIGSAMGSSTSEQSLIPVSRTGDPAQGMLDLFLGPLLKKPVEEQYRNKFSASDVDFEVRKLSQPQKNDAGEDHVVAPAMKTKSSLRDMVAMLLD